MYMSVRLRPRFTLLIVLLAIVPQILLGVFIGGRSFVILEADSLRLQQEVAANVGHQIEAFLLDAEQELLFTDEALGLGTLDAQAQKAALNNLLINQRLFQDLALLNEDGREQIYLSRSKVVLAEQLRDRAADAEFLVPVREMRTYFGAPHFDEAIREPLLPISIPILDRRKGEAAFILIANVRLKPVWDLLAELDLQNQREIFVVDEAGRIVAHQIPGVVLRGTYFDIPAADGRAPGLAGEESIIAHYDLEIGPQDLQVIVQQPTAAALALAISTSQLTLGVTAVSLVAALLLVVLITRQIFFPIENLSAAAQAVGAGDLTYQVLAAHDNEIGDLAKVFNAMTRQLRETIRSLEERVRARTTDLNASLDEQKRLVELLESKNEELEILASHDFLTEVPNRRLFFDRLDRAIKKANRYESLVALLYLDIDEFKFVNDTFGHSVGDKVLQAVSGRVQKALREMDTVARLGGDEFAIILEQPDKLESVRDVIERIQANIAKSFEIEGHRFSLSSSIGVAVFPLDADNGTELVKQADSAMYAAKDRGRNQYHFPAVQPSR